MRKSVEFIHNGERKSIGDLAPTETLLDYLRLRARKTGTKEGCCEGDCGACTVVVGTEKNGTIDYQPVNSCILFLGMIDGKELITVDDLADDDGTLHPVQREMSAHHASQCGFCTPGFVMSLFALYHGADGHVDRSTVTDQLAGNLCRCTGYKPIIDAGIAACGATAADKFDERKAQTLTLLSALRADLSEHCLFIGDNDRFFAAPCDVKQLAEIYALHPDATIVAGATDVGLWVTKHLMALDKIIHIGNVAGFDRVDTSESEIVIGAGATYSSSEQALASLDPDIGEIVRRLGSKQVRASGTIGGNIANGSPIGDMPPILIALGATLTLQKGLYERSINIEDFFLDYGKQDIGASEFVTSVSIPRPPANSYFRAYKISKRFDQDISAVMAAISIEIDDGGIIASARIAFGGMAATPKRAAKTEAALTGLSLDDGDWSQAAKTIKADFAPISDMRASASYRSQIAENLIIKAMTEIAASYHDKGVAPTRLIARTERVSTAGASA